MCASSCRCKKCVGQVFVHQRTLLRHAKTYGIMVELAVVNEHNSVLQVLPERLVPLEIPIDLAPVAANPEIIALDEVDISSITPEFPILGDVDIVKDFDCSPDIEGFDGNVSFVESAAQAAQTEPNTQTSDTSSIASLNIHHFDRFGDIDIDQCPASDTLDVYNCDQTLLARDRSTNSSSVIVDSSDDECERQSLMLKLRAFAREARVSRRHMNALMAIFRNLGFNWFPFDYRSMLKECTLIDSMMSVSAPFAQPSHAILVLVCGKCWLTRFDENIMATSMECQKCHVTTVRCPRSKCYTKCVITASLRGRVMNSLTPCFHCEIGPDSTVARRTFRFTLASYLRHAYSDPNFAHKTMAPFHGFCDLRRPGPDLPYELNCVDNWYECWTSTLDSRSVSSELWDGKLFRENSMWKLRGPRSLLLIISLDWFPPFKQQDYSVGILTVSPGNLSSRDRAKRNNTWILAVIEGPNEPGHVVECVRPCFDEIRSISDSGFEVFDVATMTNLVVFVSSPLVSADVPACAKLGNLYGHSSYFPCVSCEYRGVVCGCKPTKRNGSKPARWDNRSFRPGVDAQHVMLSGDPSRTLNPGEHISFIDSQLLLPHHLRKESDHLLGSKNITELLDKEYNQAYIDRARKKARSNGPSALTVLGPDQFRFTTGFGIEAMHTVIKGPILRLWSATVSDKFKKKWFNVNYYEDGLKTLKFRLTKFKFPIGFPSANKFVARRHSLKAEELYTVLRVCGPFVFNNILPKSVVHVWALFSKLFTNLLHYHINRQWMNSSTGLRLLVQSAFEKYLAVFGPCSMPSNFHRILHVWLDFYHWGPLRSHWAFPYERLYGALSAAGRMQNRSQVTMSIVNSIHLLYATESASESNSHGVGRLLNDTPKFVDMADGDVQNLLRMGNSWVKTLNLEHSRRWHLNDIVVILSAGCSMQADCFFVLVGLLSPPRYRPGPECLFGSDLVPPESFFVLRKLTPLTPRRVFQDSATFYTIPTTALERNENLGAQVVFAMTSLLSDDTAICSAVRFTVDAHNTILIPSFGLVNFL